MNLASRLPLCLIAVFLIAWILMVPKVPGHSTAGDASELALAGTTLGVAHSPGYPVFCLVNKTMGSLLLFGNPAYRQNVVSVLFLCGALLLMGVLFYKFTSFLWTVFIPLMLLFSPLVRAHSSGDFRRSKRLRACSAHLLACS